MGEHSAPSTPLITTSGAFAAIIAGAALTSTLGVPEGNSAIAEASVSSGSTDILNAIAECESGGKVNVVNASGHGGLFQFSQATWSSVGGAGSPQNASAAEQYKRAALLLARDGTGPWLASKACWSKNVGSTPKVSLSKIATPPPTVHKKAAVAKPKVAPPVVSTPIHDSVKAATTPAQTIQGKHVVRAGDTLSQIAASHGIGDYMMIFNKNRHLISNPDRIFPGQVLTL